MRIISTCAASCACWIRYPDILYHFRATSAPSHLYLQSALQVDIPHDSSDGRFHKLILYSEDDSIAVLAEGNQLPETL